MSWRGGGKGAKGAKGNRPGRVALFPAFIGIPYQSPLAASTGK
jgi:hypothetical protein